MALLGLIRGNGMSEEENIENMTIFILEKVINLYISYTLNLCLRNVNTDFTLNNC